MAEPSAEPVRAVEVTAELSLLHIDGWQVYVWRDGDEVTVIDTGQPGSGARILAHTGTVTQVVLTHGHVDHCGSAAELQRATGAFVAAGAGDTDAIQAGAALPPPVFEDWERPIHEQVAAGLPEAAPAVTVHRDLIDGDVLDFGGGARVLAVPGHTDGSIAIHLPEHGVLFTGDTVANVGTLSLGVFNRDRARTIEAFRRLAALDVETVCFGHGDPIVEGGGHRLREVAAELG
ncbi:MBL fold metallo-hydrolase [Mycolicibacterium thermoresistibile]|uniref:Metallo-beta-lactamase-like protein n=2 Tax=Mycolicibacterium thermoresistibile TaxID=1797 RepID=G7CG66_MYCT3|nr:MBL fold metallo-hydrolase [Mycolicibacterium thermoresistibile]EHI13495.1 metallo-beta-lactamase-like protein [Mycolicibacterium thermoresistibile ATCC 19527]MCV7188739.1 MBL fold metallo-hydrolase [Mycolicibacterium thermoresistibile]GAT16731.1 Zn-dependent hydrolase [Mycolicibacterium thermoresistibile]SNW18792.1 Zn-dependent hydrolase [Mycolicibacterium thermoresistibile]